MEVIEPKRVFLIGEEEVSDPNPNMTLMAVKHFLSAQFPKLINTNSTFQDPVHRGNKIIYKIEQKIGKKG